MRGFLIATNYCVFRPFTCSYCQSKYYRKNALSAHEAKCSVRLAQLEGKEMPQPKPVQQIQTQVIETDHAVAVDAPV